MPLRRRGSDWRRRRQSHEVREVVNRDTDHASSLYQQMTTASNSSTSSTLSAIRYQITGMDCASDAAEIDAAARTVAGVSSVRVSVASQLMTLLVDDATIVLPRVEAVVTDLGYRLDRLRDDSSDTSSDHVVPTNERNSAPRRLSSTYTRALWIVVLLNLGYGIIETLGGFVSDSQALKADALDFLGDGGITLLGLVASGWSLRWRARSALVQGLFLGALGSGVLVVTIYRVVVPQQPEAGLMGAFGVVALIVNVTAALVLIPHRTGDANVRAVWLFSRNDAIGNLAVVMASLLVAWTGRAWPDLVVAALIAVLFLHASWSIVRDALGDLRSDTYAA